MSEESYLGISDIKVDPKTKYVDFKEGPLIKILNIRGNGKFVNEQVMAGTYGYAESIFDGSLF